MFSCAKYPPLQEANITSQDVSRVDRQTRGCQPSHGLPDNT